MIGALLISCKMLEIDVESASLHEGRGICLLPTEEGWGQKERIQRKVIVWNSASDTSVSSMQTGCVAGSRYVLVTVIVVKAGRSRI